MNEFVALSLFLIFGFSLCLNIFLFFLLRKKSKIKQEFSYDAKALLADLCSGPGLLKIEYIDRGDFFLRSPRDMQK